MPHEHWVEQRRKLPRLVPKDVVAILPFVLVNLARTVRGSRFQDGDMVIYFLDVWANSAELRDPSTRALVEWYADEVIGGAEQGERFKSLMFTDLPEAEDLSEAERRLREYRSRAASFSEMNVQQQEGIYRWLRYIGRFDREFEGRERELLRATAYWRLRTQELND